MFQKRLLTEAGPDGISKVVDRFVELHSTFSKRQVELKINELAVKEKQQSDACKVWHIRPEFQTYLNSSETTANMETPPKLTKKRKAEEEDPSNSKEPKKYKRAFGFFVKAMRQEAEAKLGPTASVSNMLCLLGLCV